MAKFRQTDQPLPPKLLWISPIILGINRKQLPVLLGWEIKQRNARFLITDTWKHALVPSLGWMLNNMAWSWRKIGIITAERADTTGMNQFLLSLKFFCMAKQMADSYYAIPWNQHFITCVQQLIDTDLLVGASAVTYNPYFKHFALPHSCNKGLGAVLEWQNKNALLLLDSIDSDLHQIWLQKAADHTQRVWILRSHHPSMAVSADHWHSILLKLQARCTALTWIPAGCRLIQTSWFWPKAEWD